MINLSNGYVIPLHFLKALAIVEIESISNLARHAVVLLHGVQVSCERRNSVWHYALCVPYPTSRLSLAARIASSLSIRGSFLTSVRGWEMRQYHTDDLALFCITSYNTYIGILVYTWLGIGIAFVGTK